MKKLPVIGSSAASTAFCHERIDGLDGTYLYVDGNGKITRNNGTLDDPRPNAFSLRAQAVTDKSVAGEDCPGSTAACRSVCYVENLALHAGSTYDLYEHNSVEIRRILADDLLANDWVMRMAHWITQNVSSFRWHVSGDVFSLQYAEWIRDVCRESSTVEHWVYTRSLDFLVPLVEVSTIRGGNLAVNLSCDQDNILDAVDASFDYTSLRALRLCYLTLDGAVPDLLDTDVIFPSYALRDGTLEGRAWFAALPPSQKAMVCPVDYHSKNESRRCGPCPKCLT